MTNIGNYFEISNFVILFLQKLYVYFYRGLLQKRALDNEYNFTSFSPTLLPA